ncbi:SRPBCC domain-containing protein [Martelella sp. AMO21009]
MAGGWRPAANDFATATITLSDRPNGPKYRAQALQESRADREKHEELGFHDGWGTVVAQLAECVETKA